MQTDDLQSEAQRSGSMTHVCTERMKQQGDYPSWKEIKDGNILVLGSVL